MLDRKYIVDNVAEVKENCQKRGVTADVDQLVEMEIKRRDLGQEAQELNRKANEFSKLIGQAKDNDEREAKKEEARQVREEKDNKQREHDELEKQIIDLQRMIPNLSHPDAPVGVDDKANLELTKGQHEPRKFEFDVKDHVELGELHNLFDFEGGARTSGHGFYFLKNEAVLLELALQQYVIQLLVGEGFTPAITPDLARNEILEGIGFIPRGPETQIYSVDGTDLSLVATAEITLGGWYGGHTFDAEELPLKLCGISHCYRTEAGAHGRSTRGLYRVHQFTKVEMFAFTTPEQSTDTLDHFRDLECRIFDGLGLPYRVVDTATGDLGGPAYRKFDLEAWMPGRGDGGEYGEVTSTSNCTDYQARRLNIRYKTKGEKGTKFVHTLNGTAVAISRAMIAIVENYQQADGSIIVPEALRPFVGKQRIG
jgi:seryl-tRNA synthetase